MHGDDTNLHGEHGGDGERGHEEPRRDAKVVVAPCGGSKKVQEMTDAIKMFQLKVDSFIVNPLVGELPKGSATFVAASASAHHEAPSIEAMQGLNRHRFVEHQRRPRVETNPIGTPAPVEGIPMTSEPPPVFYDWG